MSSVFRLLKTPLFLWSIISLSLLSSASLINPAAGSRLLLRAVNSGGDHPDVVVDLNVTNFDSVLKDTPATFAVVEFFAHWCPACRNYKPQYEKVARLFNGPNAVHPGIILMTRVDCANKINNNLCDKFSISHYPTLFWAPPSKFVGGSWNGKNEKSEILSIEDGRTSDRLLKWINTKLGSSYNLDDEKYQNDDLLQSNVSDPGQIARAIYDVEEATFVAFDIILEKKMIKQDSRAALIKFMQLMTAHHPSRRCRRGTADILVNFDDLYPSNILSPNNQEIKNNTQIAKFEICGKEVPRGYWMFCRGSKKDTRGFSCGLWVLLHSLSVRIEDEESQSTFTSTCDFIHKFFACDECNKHFHEMCSRVTTPFTTTRDYALWLWTAHNEVNLRLKSTEETLKSGDPKFPKSIWPSKRLCPECHAARGLDEEETDWDRDMVFNFLGRYYGQMLKDKEVSEGSEVKKTVVSEDVTTNAFVVPVGAAVGIAVASCLFGTLACFWRSRQKNRKPRRNWS